MTTKLTYEQLEWVPVRFVSTTWNTGGLKRWWGGWTTWWPGQHSNPRRVRFQVAEALQRPQALSEQQLGEVFSYAWVSKFALFSHLLRDNPRPVRIALCDRVINAVVNHLRSDLLRRFEKRT